VPSSAVQVEGLYLSRPIEILSLPNGNVNFPGYNVEKVVILVASKQILHQWQLMCPDEVAPRGVSIHV
jgi:hypothetical protein